MTNLAVRPPNSPQNHPPRMHPRRPQPFTHLLQTPRPLPTKPKPPLQNLPILRAHIQTIQPTPKHRRHQPPTTPTPSTIPNPLHPILHNKPLNHTPPRTPLNHRHRYIPKTRTPPRHRKPHRRRQPPVPVPIKPLYHRVHHPNRLTQNLRCPARRQRINRPTNPLLNSRQHQRQLRRHKLNSQKHHPTHRRLDLIKHPTRRRRRMQRRCQPMTP